MKPAVPALPKYWEFWRHEDDSATVQMPGSARGALSLSDVGLSLLGGLLCLPGLLIFGSFYLLQCCLGEEVWRLTAKGIRIRNTVFGITWQTRTFTGCKWSVERGSAGLWELRLHEGTPDGSGCDSLCDTLYQSATLPVVLALAAFLVEELGWPEKELEIAPAYLRPTVERAFAENDTATLLLLLQDPRSRSVLSQVWGEAGPAIRTRIKSNLAAFERECAGLSQIAAEETGDLQLLAIEILGELGEPRELSTLRSLIAVPRGKARTNAMVALGLMRDTESVPALCDVLRIEPAMWRVAVAALGEIGDPRAVPALGELFEGLVRGSEADLRQQIVIALGKIGDRSTLPVLLRALNDPVPGVRVSVVEAVGKLASPDSVPALLSALRDEDEQVAARAATTLGALRDSRTVAALAGTLDTGRREVRICVVKALGQIGSVDAIPVLCRCLEDSNNEVCREAALALAQLARSCSVVPVQIRSALPILKRCCSALTNAPPEIKRACWVAMRQIEASTVSVKQLPLPVSAAVPPPDSLPLPAGGADPAGGDCSAATGDSRLEVSTGAGLRLPGGAGDRIAYESQDR